MVCDSPKENHSRQIDACLRHQMLKNMNEHATQRPRRPGEEIRVSSAALTNPDGGKENTVFLNLVEALPIQPCSHVDSAVSCFRLFVSRIPSLSRSYNNNHFSNFDQHFMTADKVR